MNPTVSHVVSAVERAFPSQWAEPWDNVGLLCGDPSAPVGRVFVSLDPTRDALSQAGAASAGLLYTHHPAFLHPLASLTAGRGPAGLIHEAVRRNIALACAHTNLDRAGPGADALARALGLEPVAPLEAGAEAVAVVTVFVPPADADRVASAMHEAGAGRIGEYERCWFRAPGEGGFTPRHAASPFLGDAGSSSKADEVRLEVVCPSGIAPAVAEAAARAHPYEEPLVTMTEGSMRRGAARLGRVCSAPPGSTIRSLAALASERLSAVPRVWGDPRTSAGTIAVVGGSGGSLVGRAIAAGASALVTGELRYHDAVDALERGLCVIEVGHDVSEWPLVAVLAESIRTTPGLSADDIVVDSPARRWWTP